MQGLREKVQMVHGTEESDGGKRGKNDLNRSRASLARVQSITQKCGRSYSCRVVRQCVEALARIMSHDKRAINRSRRCDRSLPQ